MRLAVLDFGAWHPEIAGPWERFGVMLFSILVSLFSILGGSIWIVTLPIAIIALGIYKSISKPLSNE